MAEIFRMGVVRVAHPTFCYEEPASCSADENLTSRRNGMASNATTHPQQIKRAKKLLQNLPEKEDGEARPEAVALLERDFKKAKEKGYNPKELSQLLKNEGIIIPAYLIKRFLADNRNVSFPQKAEHGEALEEGGTDLAQPFQST